MIDETMLIHEPNTTDFQESLNDALINLVYDRNVIIKDIKFHTDEHGYYGLVCFENP